MSPPKGKGKGPKTFDSGDGAGDNPQDVLPDKAHVGGVTAKEGSDEEPAAESSGNGLDPAATVAADGAPSGDATAEVPDPFADRGSAGHQPQRAEPPLFPAGDPGSPPTMPPPSPAIAAATGEFTVTTVPPAPVPDATGQLNASTGTVSRSPLSANTAVAKAGELAQRMPQLLEDGLRNRSHRVRARKVRRVVRHIDPWSVLTFSVLFHLCVFASLLLASVLVWNAAVAAGTIENIESFIRELGDYKEFEINGDVVFRSAMIIAGILTLASSVLAVLLTVVFNLISDLVGGIRMTVVEEETVRVRRRIK
jgi:hypothetical protein